MHSIIKPYPESIRAHLCVEVLFGKNGDRWWSAVNSYPHVTEAPNYLRGAILMASDPDDRAYLTWVHESFLACTAHRMSGSTSDPTPPQAHAVG